MQPVPFSDRKSLGTKILDKERPYVSSYLGPSGFHWLVNGLLGGMRMPGVLTKVRFDIEALNRINTCLLVTLTEVWQAPVEELAEQGIASYTHKITDLQAPSFEDTVVTCQLVDGYLQEDKVCVYHCRAGVGRTGTMLAAQLVYYGLSADEAIKTVRNQNPRWIETNVQEVFLRQFDSKLNGDTIQP